MTLSSMPVLFLGHGSPMNAIETTRHHLGWARAAAAIPRPRAILCVSAHWETLDLAVTASPAPPTIHDFGGFPQALFDVDYPAPGDPDLARRVQALLAPAAVRLDAARGLDHGAWGVLIAMYPDADVPVVQLSLNRSLSPRAHYDLAARLGPLRDEGVLIIGSGDIVHNLRAVDWRSAEAPDWAVRFNDFAKARILADDPDPLVDYERLGEDAQAAINSAEHYLPLLYTLAVRRPGEAVSIFNDEVQAAISMTSVMIGAYAPGD